VRSRATKRKKRAGMAAAGSPRARLRKRQRPRRGRGRLGAEHGNQREEKSSTEAVHGMAPQDGSHDVKIGTGNKGEPTTVRKERGESWLRQPQGQGGEKKKTLDLARQRDLREGSSRKNWESLRRLPPR